MKVLPAEHLCRRLNSKSTLSAFTLPELLVTVVLLAILVLVLMPILLGARESSLLASCTNNLKQIGAGCSVYASDNSDILPTVNLPGASAGSYQTSLACRTTAIPGTQISNGPYSFAQLYFYGGINNPQVFYCPTVPTGEYAYTSYTAPGYPWPATTSAYNDGNPFVRCGYNYYPQSRTLLQTVALPSGNLTLPAYNFVLQNFSPPNPPGGTPNSGTYPAPLTLSQVNLKKAMAVDALKVWASINHQYRGLPYGVNAAFPDGHVRFQTINQNNQRNSYAPFDRNDLWDPAVAEGPGETPYNLTPVPAFRIIMNGFQP